ncbi:glucohydrolase, partial [Bifidobacterium longum subsp. longum]
DAEKLLVVVNMSSRTVDLPREAAELTAVGIAEPNVVISTYDASHAVVSLANRELGPWEGAAVRV